MIHVLVTIIPKDDMISEVEELITKQYQITSELDKGLVSFTPSLSILDKKTFYILEKWTNSTELVKYRNSKQFLEYLETLKTMIISDDVKSIKNI